MCCWPCHLLPSIRGPLATVIVSILHALRSLTTSLSFSRPRAPLHVCPGPSRFPPASHSCTFSSAVPSSSTSYSIRQHHLLLQTVHSHHVTEEQHLLYVATTGLLAVIPVSLHCVFRLLVGLAYKPFHSSSFRYRLTYIDRYVINSGCVMRTGYFYPNQSRRLKCKLYFFSSTRIEEALDNFANKLSDSGYY